MRRHLARGVLVHACPERPEGEGRTLYIDIKNVPEDGQVLNRVVPRASVCLQDDMFSFATDLVLKGRIEPTAQDEKGERSFRFQGGLSGRLEVVCGRCLSRFDSNLDETLDLLYFPQSQNAAVASAATDEGGEEGRELDDEELAVAFYRDEQIDLAEMIFEQTVLSLPMKPLCRPDCAGLCSTCGVNKNEASCRCQEEESDPRWDALKAFSSRSEVS